MSKVTILKRGADFGDIYQLFDNTSISGEQMLVSDAIPLNKRQHFGAWYKATATGNPNLKLTYEMSPDDEGDNFVMPEGVGDIESALTVKTPKIKDLFPVPMPYIRFVVTGLSGNPADTKITLKVFVQ